MQDPLIGNEMSDFPVQEKAQLQEGSLPLKASLPGSSRDLNSEMTEPFQMQVQTMDLSSWSPPEVVRKDSTLELLPSLPLTPCSDAASLRGLDASPVPGDGPGLLCDPGMSTVEKSLQWAGPHSADPQHVGKTPVVSPLPIFATTMSAPRGAWGATVSPWSCHCACQQRHGSALLAQPLTGPGQCSEGRSSAFCRSGPTLSELKQWFPSVICETG